MVSYAYCTADSATCNLYGPILLVPNENTDVLAFTTIIKTIALKN